MAGTKSTAALAGKLPFGRLAAVCALLAAGAAMLTGSAVPALSVAGGFGLRFFSLILETATSNEINRELPSDQRATLISVSSILFSIAMIAATPALSFLCEALGTSIAFAISGAVLGVTAACLLFLGKSAFFPVSGKAVSSHTKREQK